MDTRTGRQQLGRRGCKATGLQIALTRPNACHEYIQQERSRAAGHIQAVRIQAVRSQAARIRAVRIRAAESSRGQAS